MTDAELKNRKNNKVIPRETLRAYKLHGRMTASPITFPHRHIKKNIFKAGN